MKKLNSSREDYLEAVLILKSKRSVVHSVDLAAQMNVTKPSVSRAVSILKEEGLLTVDCDYCLDLTPAGREIAERIYARHCFFKDKLLQAGVDRTTAEEEACRMEHVISENTFQLLLKAYGTEEPEK